MRHTFRHRAAALVIAAGCAAFSACADGPSSPPADRADADLQRLIDAPAAAPVARPAAAEAAAKASVGAAGDTSYATFTVTPAGGVFAIGRHWISFPAGSVCDPARASYGPSEWNKACPLAAAPVTIHAKTYADAAGVPIVEFAEHLRFDPTKQVILHLSFDYREGDVAPEILWQSTGAGEAVDEGAVDPALVTRDGNYWMVYRRVKHFSGYIVTTGRISLGDASVSVDVSLARPGSGATRPEGHQSGHVVATGRKGGHR